MKGLCFVYITASNKKEAEKIAGKLVALRLAACANIYGGVTSVYRWNGKVEKNGEAVIMLKTRKKLLPKIKSTVKKLHSYDCPCVVAFAITDASREFADWVMKETG